jgi:hypothetical protein
MRSEELRQFEIEGENGEASFVRCPGCDEYIIAYNLDQANKAARRHSIRHAEAEMNVIENECPAILQD